MSNQVAKAKKPISDYFCQPNVKNKLNEILGKNTPSFVTSVLQIANSNALLKTALPESVFNAACMAATLNLPINNNLGFAYIVPFKKNFKDENGQWQNVVEAQFQLGYKGFIQLAQRSGQFKRINACAVYSGDTEETVLSRLTSLLPASPVGDITGYIAYFELLNGYTDHYSMSLSEINKHANKYSQSFKNNSGVWKDNFDAMALKTVIKLLLSKKAPLSIDMQKAVLADQAVVKDVDSEQFEYIDHTPEYNPVGMDLTNDDEMFQVVIKNIKSGELDKISVLSGEAGYTFSDEQKQIIVEA